MLSASAPCWRPTNLNPFVSGYAMSVRKGVGASAGVKRKMINNEEGPTGVAVFKGVTKERWAPRRAANFDTVFLPALCI